MEQTEQVVEAEKVSVSQHIAKTFLWVFLALLVSAATAYLTVTTNLWVVIFSNDFMYYGIVILELVLVAFLSARVEKMNFITALLCLLGYAILTGITFSVLIIAFTPKSIGLAFGFTALLFLDLAVIGMTTKFDISKISPLLFSGLLIMVIVSIVGLFMDLSTMEVGLCYVGIVIFMGLTAYDTQNIKRLYYMSEDNPKLQAKLSIYSALELYLDFINIFLYVLRLLGKHNDN